MARVEKRKDEDAYVLSFSLRAEMSRLEKFVLCGCSQFSSCSSLLRLLQCLGMSNYIYCMVWTFVSNSGQWQQEITDCWNVVIWGFQVRQPVLSVHNPTHCMPTAAHLQNRVVWRWTTFVWYIWAKFVVESSAFDVFWWETNTAPLQGCRNAHLESFSLRCSTLKLLGRPYWFGLLVRG